jgi:hypothetical protein
VVPRQSSVTQRKIRILDPATHFTSALGYTPAVQVVQDMNWQLAAAADAVTELGRGECAIGLAEKRCRGLRALPDRAAHQEVIGSDLDDRS